MEPLPDDQHIGGDPSRAAAECLPRGRKRGRPSDLERLQREARAEALADLAAQQDGAEAEARAEAGHAEFPCDVNPLAKELKIPTEVARSAGTIGLMSAIMPLGAHVLKYAAARPRLDLDGIDEETQTFSQKVWGGSCPGTSAASLKNDIGCDEKKQSRLVCELGAAAEVAEREKQLSMQASSFICIVVRATTV